MKFVMFGLFCGALLTQALALPTVTFKDSVGNGPGGQFTATTSQNVSFETFCLERNEYLNFSDTFNYSVNTAAVSGGVSGGNPDYLSLPTAWLYSRFVTGTLPGYIYGDAASADQLQDAIWFLEGELDNPGLGAALVALATGPSGANALPTVPANGAYGVRVLNVTFADGSPGQDVLHVPDAASSFCLLGIGMVSLAFAARRIR